MRRGLTTRTMPVVALLIAMLSGCATSVGAPSNRGWDAPSPAVVRQFGP